MFLSKQPTGNEIHEKEKELFGFTTQSNNTIFLPSFDSTRHSMNAKKTPKIIDYLPGIYPTGLHFAAELWPH